MENFLTYRTYRGAYQVVKDNAKKAGIDVPGFCVHSARATAIPNALENGADIAHVQQWAGHARMRVFFQRITNLFGPIPQKPSPPRPNIEGLQQIGTPPVAPKSPPRGIAEIEFWRERTTAPSLCNICDTVGDENETHPSTMDVGWIYTSARRLEVGGFVSGRAVID